MQCCAIVKKIIAGSVLAGMLVGFIACEHQLAEPPPPLEPTLSSIQANILDKSCVNRGCHPGNFAPMSLQTGQSFSTLVNVNSAYGNPRILRVKPGDSNNSVLYLKITGSATVGGAANRMPLGFSALSTEEINAIRDWIDAGAQNN